MTQNKEVFEEVPSFIEPPVQVTDETGTVKEQEASVVSADIRLFNPDDEQLFLLKELQKKPASLKIPQAHTLVNFDNYKGELSSLFKDLSVLYQAVSRWENDNPLEITGQFINNELNQILGKFAYLPNHNYLANLIEVMVIGIVNGNIDIGTLIDSEITFQSFKRIYNPRVQAILLPLLLYIYNLDRKLLPVKKTAWQLLNKYGRNTEASFLMYDIQKSMIRLKKAQELLIQEKYNLEEKFSENIDLLLALTDKSNVLYPLLVIYQESLRDKELNVEEVLIEVYGIETTPPRPLSQQLLTYKIGDTGQQVMKQIMKWPGSNTSAGFRQYLTDSLAVIISDVTVEHVNFPGILREVVFSVTDIAKRHSWSITELICDLEIAVFNSVYIEDINQARVVAYNLASEVICGVLKVKYKIDEAINGLAKGLVFLFDNLSGHNRVLLANCNNFKIISEFIYSGLWDTVLEIYPNLLTVERNADLFVTCLKNELQKVKTVKQSEELQEFQIVNQ